MTQSDRYALGTDTYVLAGQTSRRVGDMVSMRPWEECGDGAWTTGAPVRCPIIAIRAYSLDRDEVEIDLSAIASGYAVLDDPYLGGASARLPI